MSCQNSRSPASTGETEDAVLRALGDILRRGAVGAREAHQLASAAADAALETGARGLARHALQWLGLEPAWRH